MNHHRVGIGATLAVLIVALVMAGCGGSDDGGGSGGGNTNAGSDGGGGGSGASKVSGDLSVVGVWTGDEQKKFEAVLDAFTAENPGVTIRYQGAGDQLSTVLSTAVQGGNPPDVALLPQPGAMKDFVDKGALKPIAFIAPELKANYAPVWATLGQVDGTQYGLVFYGNNKSTVWYNVPAFEAAGIEPPGTWDELLDAAKTLNASGVDAYSIGGADGWTLTDLFENIYLRQAGAEKYDQLAAHEIKWTDPTVETALTTMGDVLDDSDNIAGGTSGALQTDFPTSVSQAFGASPKAALVFEGAFVAGTITDSTKAKPESGFNQFPFPEFGDSGDPVVGGGAIAVMFEDTPAAQALMKFFATPEAGEVRAKLGGASMPNKNVSPDVYPDPITRDVAVALADAEVFRFDLSDLQPAAFGGTVGQGMFKAFQDLLRDPEDVNGIAAQLERDAKKAYASK